MKEKYLVKIRNLCESLLEVEAEHSEDAREKAKKFFEENMSYVLSMKDYYVSTTAPESWLVITKKEFEQMHEDAHGINQIKENASLLIHRAQLIDRKIKTEGRQTLAGMVENYIYTSNLIKAEEKVEEKQLELSESVIEEIKSLHEKDPNMDDSYLKYLDPKRKIHPLLQLYRDKKNAEIKLAGNKILNKDQLDNIIEGEIVKSPEQNKDDKNLLSDKTTVEFEPIKVPNKEKEEVPVSKQEKRK